MLLIFHLVDLNKCNNNPSATKITVIGTAVELKQGAAVRTDENIIYDLDGVYSWDDEYLGKRVKVTGRLVFMEYHEKKNPNPEITAIPGQRYGKWRVIKRPKWNLVE